MLQEEQRIAMVVNKEDPSAAVLSEDWETKKTRLRAASPYGHLSNWRLISVIVKNGTDLRQEQFAVQLIREMQLIWADTGVNVWVKYFRILVTSDSSGLMETLRNTISIHSIKKNAYTRGWNQKDTMFTLYDYFKKVWGPPESEEYIKAQDAFMQSLAGYSIACYVLQIKDRHNGNLLIDESGHLIHIDFGFMLSNSPGSVGFEMAPFKLPQEYIDILGGVHGEKFAEYKALMKAAFLAVRKHSENILLLTEMMSIDSKLPCFQNGELTVAQLRDRFQLHLTEPQAEEFVDKLIMSSCCNVFTKLYDTFQYYSQVRNIC
ncbi:kinase-like protein [Backusella circina FSU 941]|nr:kinase-like protein [Backusella circina FSU 941]